jgi:hypothetical protein
VGLPRLPLRFPHAVRYASPFRALLLVMSRHLYFFHLRT